MTTIHAPTAKGDAATLDANRTHRPPEACWPDPEFVDCKGLEAGWGIKRSLAYALLAEGKIQGVSLRRRNQLRGKRLFKVDSVRAFLNAQMAAGK